MFESALRRSLLGRVLPVYWIAVPVVFGARLLEPFQSVIYISRNPFQVESNTLQSGLPRVAAEVLYSYPTTFLACGVLILSVGVAEWSQRAKRRAAPVWLPVIYLPAFVFGIEAVKHIRAISRRHYWVANPPSPAVEVTRGMVASAFVFLATVVLCSLVAIWINRPKVAGGAFMPVPPVLIAIAVAVGLDWFVFWSICQPAR